MSEILKLEILNLRKSFVDADRRLSVIEGLNYTFPEIASVAIVGRSGVGKSTLLHLLAGLDTPDSGEVTFNGTDITKLSSEDLSSFRCKNIGFIFQFHHLLSDFTALENVAMPLIIQGESEEDAQQKALSILTRVGLKDRVDHGPGELSGGEQQRVAIARAVVSNPRVLLADEPTGNLDVSTADDVGRILLDVQREKKILLIIVTHSYQLAKQMDVILEMMPGGNLMVVDKSTDVRL